MRAKRARPPSISRRWKNVSRNESGNSLMTSTIAVIVNEVTITMNGGGAMLETLTMKENQSNSNTTEFVAALIFSHDHQRNGRSGAKAPSLLAYSLLAPCDGSRPATPAGCCPYGGECSQQGCRGRSRRVLEVTAAGNGKGTFRHIATMSRNVPIACPNAYNTIAIRYAPPRSIAPESLHRSRPFSGATRPRTPANFGGETPPYPRHEKACSLLARCLFVAGGFRNCSLAVALYRLFVLLLVACSLLARCCRHFGRAWP